MYPANDQIRQSLAMITADMLKPLGISVKAEGKSWDEIGSQKIQPHGHSWPVTDNIAEWKWID